ncbi:MAG: hypothetical protein LKK08_06180 [Bacteroidales bacterium]|nr:hypothetical protein [Bacteroidales bacterium]
MDTITNDDIPQVCRHCDERSIYTIKGWHKGVKEIIDKVEYCEYYHQSIGRDLLLFPTVCRHQKQ